MFSALLQFLSKIFCFSSYVSNKASYPQPLAPELEAEYLQKFKDGDDEAREILIKHNLRLVAHIAKKYSHSMDVDDLISIGSIGLVKGISTFEVKKGTQLATYLARCIENEILMHLRKTNKTRAEVSFDEPLNVDFEGNMLVLSDVLGTDPDCVYNDVEGTAEKEMLRDTFDKLPERERSILELRFGLYGKDEMTQKEIADMMGISQSYISRLEKKIVGNLKKNMQKLG